MALTEIHEALLMHEFYLLLTFLRKKLAISCISCRLLLTYAAQNTRGTFCVAIRLADTASKMGRRRISPKMRFFIWYGISKRRTHF